ncbi:MAG: class I tRNA ligase family protein, partial [Candidatus Hodarchaeales archaeon]
KTLDEARKSVIEFLGDKCIIRNMEDITHQVSTCERCGIKTEIIMSWQWKLDILLYKDRIIADARRIKWWHPEYMIRRLENWVNGLRWDWIISRQRYYGIPIPAWTCDRCGRTVFPSREELPVDPGRIQRKNCPYCGNAELTPDRDVFDTWMTSSLTPRILHELYFAQEGIDFIPFDLRPQAHEIIRTWAMYTIYKESVSGSNTIPWKNIVISGWGLGFHEKGKRKIKASKSSGSGFDPIYLCKEYGVDAFRYWTAMARLGKDQYLNERTLIRGRKLVTKIYNATRITLILYNNRSDDRERECSSNLQLTNHIKEMKESIKVIKENYESLMMSYNYTDALKLIEKSFWKKYCSEMIEAFKKVNVEKGLNNESISDLIVFLGEYLKLFAPFLPFITEYCWTVIWKTTGSVDTFASIHRVAK